MKNSNFGKFAAAMLLVAYAPQAAWGAEYYVKFDTGNNNNAGTINSPWKHCPGDPQATGNAKDTVLGPGDTVYLHNGTVYRGQIQLLWSGANGNPITYDGESWGNGWRAQIDGENNRTWGISDQGQKRDWLHIKGFHIYDQGGYKDSDPIWNSSSPVPSRYGYGLRYEGGGTDSIIERVLAERCGVWQNRTNVNDASIQGKGFGFRDNKRLLVKECEARKTSHGFDVLFATAVHDILFDSCIVSTNIRWGWDVAAYGNYAYISNATWRGCVAHDYQQYASGSWKGQGEKPHVNGIFFRSGGFTLTGVQWHNVVVDGCHLYSDPENAAGNYGGTSSIYVTQGASVTIRNSIFAGDVAGNGNICMDVGARPGTAPAIIRIYYNTFISHANPPQPWISTPIWCDFVPNSQGGPLPQLVEIYGNVIVRTHTTQNGAPAMRFDPEGYEGWVKSDYNLFWTKYATPGSWGMVNDRGTYRTFSAWRAKGFDQHSILADPMFVSTTLPQSTFNLRLQPGSPAINAGTNLIGWFLTDKDGFARPFTGPWDIGAYEYAPASGSIIVSGNGNNIQSGDTTPSLIDGTSFGTLLTTNGVSTNTFTISHTGATPVNLTGLPYVSLSGSADFTVVEQPAAASVAPGSPRTFKIRFAPSSDGLRTATVTIPHDGISPNPYTFMISGTGYTPGPPPAEGETIIRAAILRGVSFPPPAE